MRWMILVIPKGYESADPDTMPDPVQLKAMQATVPMNRLGTADECAGTFVYLASDEMSGYVTGQIIEVNGGQYMP